MLAWQKLLKVSLSLDRSLVARAEREPFRLSSLHCDSSWLISWLTPAKRRAEHSLTQRLLEEATARQALEQALSRRSDEGERCTCTPLADKRQCATEMKTIYLSAHH